jgi:hypothetical protein
MKKDIKDKINIKDEDFIKFVNEFRSIWKGLKPGAMGSLDNCKLKLSKWIEKNPTYSKEEIINAAKAYIRSLDSYKFLQQADYFIYKKDLNGESSRLSAFIEEKNNNYEEWTTNLK